MSKTATDQALPLEAVLAIENAPDELLHALQRPHARDEILSIAFQVLVARLDHELTPDNRGMTLEREIVYAIRETDLIFRAETGSRLERIADYERYRPKGTPGRQAIYNRFGKWPLALLAARSGEHMSNARRRSRGGNWTTPQFDEAQLERALLSYAETHAGLLPGLNEYKDWQRHRPELPSHGQIVKRRNKNSGNAQRKWADVVKLAARRAQREDGWPLTRLRLEFEDPS